MAKWGRWSHEQAFVTARSTVSGSRKECLAVLVERDGSNPAVTSSSSRDVLRIKGGIPNQSGGERLEGLGRVLRQGANVREVVFVEGYGVRSEHDGTRVGGGGDGTGGAVSPEECFLFFRRAIGV
jgi:hypothetical protein